MSKENPYNAPDPDDFLEDYVQPLNNDDSKRKMEEMCNNAILKLDIVKDYIIATLYILNIRDIKTNIYRDDDHKTKFGIFFTADFILKGVDYYLYDNAIWSFSFADGDIHYEMFRVESFGIVNADDVAKIVFFCFNSDHIYEILDYPDRVITYIEDKEYRDKISEFVEELKKKIGFFDIIKFLSEITDYQRETITRVARLNYEVKSNEDVRNTDKFVLDMIKNIVVE